ncbi:MAG TPA: HAD-IG family 5'-nucleotidase, partial [Rubricoccaceae bacterium]|nr:HAD-IG family 5'-nucleotidase [Rubricoccaceae bacterium]
ERAHTYIKNGLAVQGWPVDTLAFDPDLVTQGLVVDVKTGNVVKANRFGYVQRAFHGTRPLPYDVLRETYARTLVDLHDRRWRFMNTLFSISEAGLYLQLVDLLDAGRLPERVGYDDLYAVVRRTLDDAHLEGLLKAEIIQDPARFVDLDPEVPLTLLDQKEAGKKVILITNSEWDYASAMLAFAFDPFLPEGTTWRDLFSLAIVGARKPQFFSERAPAFHVVSEDGLLREHRGPLQEGHAYVGGHAKLVEDSLGLKGEDILYVGDHVFADVKQSKSVHRWRTALVLRALEDETAAHEAFQPQQDRLTALMARKEALEARYSALRLERQRNARRYGPRTRRRVPDLDREIQAVRTELLGLDAEIAPLAQAAGQLVNPHWGPLLRAGNDKSLLARQVEASADVYTARVSSFLAYTPFVYLRSHRGSLPHDISAPQEEGGEEALQEASDADAAAGPA